MHAINEIAFYAIPPAAGPVDGFSYAGLKTVSTLNALGVKTPWRDDNSSISISFCQPDWYSQSEEQFRVGYTPWESTKIPEWWVPHMNNMDLMWTTSQWCKDVFINNGVENEILVVPHGIDPTEWTIENYSRLYKTFTFFHMGEPATRKNGQMVMDAFIKVFDGNPYVNLLFKANGSADVRLREPFGPVTNHRQVKLITGKYTLPELNALYHSVNCMVYPSSGEGFGMIPFQAIATGMPTILVNYGGVKEFGHYGIPVEYTESVSTHDYHLGEWAHPSFSDLCDKMEDVYLNYESHCEESYNNALKMREEFAWPVIIGTALDDLKLRINS